MQRLLASLILLLAAASVQAQQAYKSPYTVKFNFELKDLVGDLDGPRGDIKKQADVDYRDWYDTSLQRRFTTWGPSANHFPMPAGLSQKSTDWMRERVITVAMRYVGYRYQHHHIPDWDPPQDWPYSKTPLGKHSKGLDCSNFTSWVYNLALGLKPNSATREQSELTEVPGPGPNHLSKVQRIERPASYEDYAKTLKTGDLLFVMRQSADEVTHVVIWVGKIGVSRNDVPLVIDSTGDGRKDEDGNEIPDGIHLRPFSTKSWYYLRASHALRLIPDAK